jgi:PEP-CTERM motif
MSLKTVVRLLSGCALVAACGAAAQPASAAVVFWTNWTGDTVGSPTGGSATGTIAAPGGSITVTYSGEVTSETVVNGTSSSGYPSWLPSSTYADGTVVQDAPTFRDIIAQNGGAGTGVNTITFSKPILDPVMAIWSLGSGGDDANYTFSGSEPFTIVAGGPSDEYGGSSIVPNGGADSVTGSEGNGTLQFIGTYSQITFTNTNFENWYGFTIGVDGIAPPPVTGAPEPASVALLGLGLAGLGAIRRRTRTARRAIPT